MYKRLFIENEITPKMVRWFHKRTNAHINAVKVFAKRIYRNKKLRPFINGELFIKDILEHDKSKFEEPEYIPYIRLVWRHKVGDEEYKKPGTLEDGEINKATLHHIKVGNPHHPEYWTDQKEGILNKNDRNGIPEQIVNAAKMPLTYIASMIADWMAMSKELGNSPYDWAKKNINVRWKFDKEQIDFIYLILDEIWKK